MPHKRAKKSIRDKDKDSRKSDLPPSQSVAGFQNNGDFPKSAAWVLNAESVRGAYREKRKREKEGDGGDGEGKKKRKRKAEDGRRDVEAALRAKASLTIKPGESLKHFNRRVEDDMRPLVRTAMSSTVSTSRQKRKAAEKDEESNTPAKPKDTKKHTQQSKPEPEVTSGRSKRTTGENREFDRLPSSAPKRLNDIAQAPPQLAIGSRLTSKATNNSSGAKSDNVVSVAQKRMMDLEREKAIARYRALKTAKH